MTQRDRIVLGVVALVAVLAGFYLTVAKPSTTEVADLDTQIAAAEQRRDTALNDLRTAAAAREQYQADQTTLAVLGKAVPADDGVPSLLYQVHKAARKAGISFDSVTVGEGASAAAGETDATPGTTPGPEGLAILPLTIKFDGSFFKLDRFLREVHRFARIGEERVDVRGRLLTVDAFDLKPIPDSSLLEATMTVNAYVAQAGSGTAGSASGAASGDATTSASDADAGSSDAGGSSGDASDSTPTPSTGTAQ